MRRAYKQLILQKTVQLAHFMGFLHLNQIRDRKEDGKDTLVLVEKF